jgi:hypothetical protein
MGERDAPAGHGLVDALNRDCHCISVDREKLRETLEARFDGSHPSRLETHPTLLASSPVFLSRDHVDRMRHIIRSIETVVATTPYRQHVLASAPEIAREGHGPLGVFFGYDFHLAADGPRLIEINTNAGGALLNLYLADAQLPCCDEIEALLGSGIDLMTFEKRFVEMFRNEWRLQRPSEEIATIAIVDESPPSQVLHPEMLLFRKLFERSGIEAHIADPRELAFHDGSLWLGKSRIDLVYNRLTDFYLASNASSALGTAYRTGSAVFSPSPHVHALYANKHNLTLLSDGTRLREWGIDDSTARTLEDGIPHSVVVTPEAADRLWSRRRQLFFKPATGYGSRGAYRGAKLTRRVWQSILEGDYIAQDMIPPSERQLVVDGASRSLKVDIRCYVYDGEIQLLAARVYQGQATNLRTEGGGLATVVIVPVEADREPGKRDGC